MILRPHCRYQQAYGDNKSGGQGKTADEMRQNQGTESSEKNTLKKDEYDYGTGSDEKRVGKRRRGERRKESGESGDSCDEEILKKLLKARAYKWNELLEEAVKEYVAKYDDEEADIPDLKGKFGSNFSLLEEDGEVAFDKATNLCTLAGGEKKKGAHAAQAEKSMTAAAEDGGSVTGKAVLSMRLRRHYRRRCVRRRRKWTSTALLV